MAQVESFNLDHTKVHAPYVRRAGRHVTAHGDIISKWDLRFSQPNTDALPSGAVHTLEHLLAGGLRDHLPQVIDLSPMGCRTGFYLVHDGELEEEAVKHALELTLRDVAATERIPASALWSAAITAITISRGRATGRGAFWRLDCVCRKRC